MSSETERRMPEERRPYVKRARAEGEAQTRERIVSAAVSLWREQGPRATTMTSVAERAGVRRSTLYRHFHSEEALCAASTSQLTLEMKMPRCEELADISYGPERLTAGLSMAYAFHRREGVLMADISRDTSVARIPAPLHRAVVEWRREMQGAILDGLGTGSDLRPAALAHALSFEAWHSLCIDLGLPDEEAVRAMTAMVRAL